MGEGMDEILPPVLQSTLGIRELCGESSLVLPLESGSSEGLAVVMAPSPSQLPASVDSGVSTHSAEALFARELSGLLASLEAACPGYGRTLTVS
jgi:hypothetical protein